MPDVVIALLLWGSYGAWLALFAWLAWTGRWRVLAGVGMPMLIVFAIGWRSVDQAMNTAGRDHSGDMGVGLFAIALGAVLLVPLVLALIVYPIGRVWHRHG